MKKGVCSEGRGRRSGMGPSLGFKGRWIGKTRAYVVAKRQWRQEDDNGMKTAMRGIDPEMSV